MTTTKGGLLAMLDRIGEGEVPDGEARAELEVVADAASALGLELAVSAPIPAEPQPGELDALARTWAGLVRGEAETEEGKENRAAIEAVLGAIRGAPEGISVAELVKATGLEEKTVRNAIDRARYVRDARLISFKKRVWTAEALEAAGVPLCQRGPRGIWRVDRDALTGKKPAKPKEAGKGKGKGKAAAKRQSGAVGNVTVKVDPEKLKELSAMMKRGELDPAKVGKLIASRFARWQVAKKALEDARAQAKQMVGAAEVAFTQAIELEVEVGNTEMERQRSLDKLATVEVAWQDLEEARSGATELRKAARETMKRAEKALAKAVEDWRQMDLFERDPELGEDPKEDQAGASPA